MARDRHILRVENGPEAGSELVLQFGRSFTVGRASDSQLRLSRDDESASRYHAVLDASAEGVEVRDLQSRNGTYVNGQRVPAAMLHPGDRLRVGKTELRMIHPDARMTIVDPLDMDWLDRELAQNKEPLSEPTRPEASPQLVAAAAVAGLGCDGCGRRPSRDAPPTFAGSGWLCEACGAARTELGPADPRRMGSFQILRVIGRGGMGLVYEGRQRAFGTHAAIKTLIPEIAIDPVLVSRFMREQRRAIELRHPKVVRSFEVGQDADCGELYMATEWLAGGDASELGSPQFDMDLALTLGADLFEAIAYLKVQSLVHRDIKPANVLLAPPSGGARIAGKLADFGIARNLREAGSRVTADGATIGTPLYAAPEQLLDSKWVGHGADIYAGAATLYFLITGVTPLSLPQSADFHPIAVYTAALDDTRIPVASRRADAPRELCEWIDAAVARDPAARDRMDASQVAAWLRELAG